MLKFIEIWFSNFSTMKKYFSSGFFLLTWFILLLSCNVFIIFRTLQLPYSTPQPLPRLLGLFWALSTVWFGQLWFCLVLVRFSCPKKMFFGETEGMVAIRAVFDFCRTPQLLYSTPGPLSRLSVHSRASFTVSFLSQAFTGSWYGFGAFRADFSLRKRSPNTVKPPLRCKFDFFVRVAALKFA